MEVAIRASAENKAASGAAWMQGKRIKEWLRLEGILNIIYVRDGWRFSREWTDIQQPPGWSWRRNRIGKRGKKTAHNRCPWTKRKLSVELCGCVWLMSASSCKTEAQHCICLSKESNVDSSSCMLQKERRDVLGMARKHLELSILSWAASTKALAKHHLCTAHQCGYGCKWRPKFRLDIPLE